MTVSDPVPGSVSSVDRQFGEYNGIFMPGFFLDQLTNNLESIMVIYDQIESGTWVRFSWLIDSRLESIIVGLTRLDPVPRCLLVD